MPQKKQKRKNKSERYVQVCPQCFSSDIENDSSNALAARFALSHVKKCNNCGHHGSFFPEVHQSKLKKTIPKEKTKNIQHASIIINPERESSKLIIYIILIVIFISIIFTIIELFR